MKVDTQTADLLMALGNLNAVSRSLSMSCVDRSCDVGTETRLYSQACEAVEALRRMIAKKADLA